MSHHVATARRRYAQNKHDAYRAAAGTLSPIIGTEFQITEVSGRALRALSSWEKSRFDWEDIFRRHNDPDRLDMAIWHEHERLCGLALGTSSGQAIVLRFVEGDPRETCPLKGVRFLIALEAAVNYAQARGKREIRLQPKTDALVYLYETVYGFVLESPRNEAPYYRKGV